MITSVLGITICQSCQILPQLQVCLIRVDATRDNPIGVTSNDKPGRQFTALGPSRACEGLDNHRSTLVWISRLLAVVRIQGLHRGAGPLRQIGNGVLGLDPVPGGQEVGAEVAGLEAGDLDAEVGDLETQGLGYPGGAGLGRAVQAGGCGAAPAADAAQVGHGAAPLPAHDGQDGAEDVELAKDIGVEGGLDLFVAALFDAAGEDVPGVVDQDIDPASCPGQDALHDGCESCVRVCDIKTFQDGTLLTEACQLLGVSSRGNDSVASGKSSKSNILAETRRASCDYQTLLADISFLFFAVFSSKDNMSG